MPGRGGGHLERGGAQGAPADGWPRPRDICWCGGPGFEQLAGQGCGAQGGVGGPGRGAGGLPVRHRQGGVVQCQHCVWGCCPGARAGGWQASRGSPVCRSVRLRGACGAPPRGSRADGVDPGGAAPAGVTSRPGLGRTLGGRRATGRRPPCTPRPRRAVPPRLPALPAAAPLRGLRPPTPGAAAGLTPHPFPSHPKVTTGSKENQQALGKN